MPVTKDFAKLLITLASAAIVLAINILIAANVPNNPYRDRFIAGAAVAIAFFGYPIGAMVIFIILLDLFYEQCTHSEQKDTYTASKYALVQAFGTLGLLCFVIGCGMVISRIF